METTPVHPRLWHRDFWLLAVADLLLTMTTYMILPLLAQWISVDRGQDYSAMVWVMGAYAIGLFLLGPFCNYLVQSHRRNHVYMVAAFGVMLAFALLAFDMHGFFGHHLPFTAVFGVRVMQGAAFGLAQMVLLSTLAVDVAESAQRTEANHALSWFSRLAMVLGPLAGFELLRFFSVGIVFIVLAAMAFLAMVLVGLAKIPFKAPDDEYATFSNDRFFLPNARWLFFNNLLFATIVGILLYIYVDAYCYLMLLVGFYVALRMNTHFLTAPKKNWHIWIVLASAALALLCMYFMPILPLFYFSFLLWGFLIGLVNSQMSVMYIHVSRHCQRGTSQSTNFLSWEIGVVFGVIIAIGLESISDCFMLHIHALIAVAILFVLFFLSYFFFTLPWCLRHHQREKV